MPEKPRKMNDVLGPRKNCWTYKEGQQQQQQGYWTEAGKGQSDRVMVGLKGVWAYDVHRASSDCMHV